MQSWTWGGVGTGDRSRKWGESRCATSWISERVSRRHSPSALPCCGGRALAGSGGIFGSDHSTSGAARRRRREVAKPANASPSQTAALLPEDAPAFEQ